MIAFSIDNLLFFLLIAVAALFQVLSKTVSKARKSESDETPESTTPKIPRPIRRAPAESDADRIHKFLEALGQPPTSTPPPPVAPRTDVAPRRLAPVQPPPVLTRRWVLPREQRQKPDVTREESVPAEQPSRFHEMVSPTVPAPAVSAVEVHEALPIELQQSPIVQTSVDASAGPKRFGVAKEADLTIDVATFLESKSGLREAIILREIFGPPRGLQTFDSL